MKTSQEGRSISDLRFTIENRANTRVLQWHSGGCHPASSAEVEMFDMITRLRAELAKFDDPNFLHVHCVRNLSDSQVSHLFGDRMTEIQNDREIQKQRAEKAEVELATWRQHAKDSVGFEGYLDCLLLEKLNAEESLAAIKAELAEARKDSKWRRSIGALTVFRDGNAWCAVLPDFFNLQESPAWFGGTAQEAVDAALAGKETKQ